MELVHSKAQHNTIKYWTETTNSTVERNILWFAYHIPYTASHTLDAWTVNRQSSSFFFLLFMPINLHFIWNDSNFEMNHRIDMKNEEFSYFVCNTLFEVFSWKTTKWISILRFELISTIFALIFLFLYFHLTIFHHFMYLTILVHVTIAALIHTKRESQAPYSLDNKKCCGKNSIY